ncbi:hypothetical protein [Tahibacter harae]|uniref:Uncharacterized protein n=1 Tax=Tahibacter harae TaxID=2963937 RepID=A0ABT1QPK5_9GAMM|nr:hypothetical protein [Tahibacter harae]MCQ4164220.1 hypothetical protein [Tahibacter harae]
MSNPICPAWRQGKGIGKFNGREEFSEFNLPHELKLLIADDEFCQAAIGRLAGVAPTKKPRIAAGLFEVIHRPEARWIVVQR